MELNIENFDELESYFKRKAQHVEELEHENIELTIENRRLHQEVDRLKKSKAEYINQILNAKKPSAETDDQADITTAIIPHILRKREQ